jgi:hypothetical protein
MDFLQYQKIREKILKLTELIITQPINLRFFMVNNEWRKLIVIYDENIFRDWC